MTAAKELEGGVLQFKNLARNIEFRSLHFSYPKDQKKPALKNISLTVPAGKMTAIVGRSGSGKSTL